MTFCALELLWLDPIDSESIQHWKSENGWSKRNTIHSLYVYEKYNGEKNHQLKMYGKHSLIVRPRIDHRESPV